MAVKIASNPASYVGLSSDDKPTAGVSAGSVFDESDTGTRYVYTGAAWVATIGVRVGGYAAVVAATQFARPADTTQYAAGDLVANSGTAGSVVPLSFAAGRVVAGTFHVRRCRIKKSGTGVTNAAFRLHLYASSPTPANGDNGAWSTSGAAAYLGSLSVAEMLAFTDGAVGEGVVSWGSEITVQLASGQTIYGLLEARGAYTPASGETWDVSLETVQN